MDLTIGWIVVCALMCVTCWPIFTKAGEPGWKCLIPIYGAVVFMRIVGRPWWWVLWLCVPVLGLIPALIVSLDLARVFGKGAGFGLGVALFGPVFMAILAFGKAEYQGTSGSSPKPQPQPQPQPMRKAA